MQKTLMPFQTFKTFGKVEKNNLVSKVKKKVIKLGDPIFAGKYGT